MMDLPPDVSSKLDCSLEDLIPAKKGFSKRKQSFQRPDDDAHEYEKRAKKEYLIRTVSGIPHEHKFKNPYFAEFDIGFDINSCCEKEKRQQRSARFAVLQEDQKIIKSPKKNDMLSKSLDDILLLNKSSKTNMKMKPKTKIGKKNGRGQRREADVSAGIRDEAMYVYGLHSWCNADVIHAFKQFNMHHVEWLNDAACNVVFKDKHAAALCLKAGEEKKEKKNGWKTLSVFVMSKGEQQIVEVRQSTYLDIKDPKADSNQTTQHNKKLSGEMGKRFRRNTCPHIHEHKCYMDGNFENWEAYEDEWEDKDMYTECHEHDGRYKRTHTSLDRSNFRGSYFKHIHTKGLDPGFQRLDNKPRGNFRESIEDSLREMMES